MSYLAKFSLLFSTFSIFGNSRLNLEADQIGILFSSMGIYQVFFRTIVFNKFRNKLGDTKTALFGLGNYIFSYFLLGLVLDYWSMMVVLFYISTCGACSRGIITAFASRVVDFRNQGKLVAYLFAEGQ